MPAPLLAGFLTFIIIEYLGLGYQFPILQKLMITTILPILMFVYVTLKYGLSETFSNRQIVVLTLLLVMTASGMLHGLVSSYAIDPFKAQLGYAMMLVVGIYVMRKPEALRTFLWVMVFLHVYAVLVNLHRFEEAARAGRFQNVGYFLGDGNDFAWSLVVVFAYALYLVSTSKSTLYRAIAFGAALIILIGVVGTKSRGATIALSAAMLYFLLFISKRKLAGLVVVTVVAMGVWLVAPSGYFERMETLSEYEEDSSAQGRLRAWGHAYQMALDHPFLGVGAGSFNSAYGRFYRQPDDPARWISTHSMYFKVMAEYGFTGLILFLSFLYLNFADNQRTARRLRTSPDGRVIPHTLPLYLNMALVGFVVAGTFLGGVEYPHLFLISAATIAVKLTARDPPESATAEPDNPAPDSTSAGMSAGPTGGHGPG